MNTKRQHRIAAWADRLAANRLGFKAWLAAQQLEEAGFLYEQRRYLLDSDALSWVDLGDNEVRCLRHLHALTLLDALDDADLGAMVTEPGELHTLVSLYCRKGCFDRMAARIDAADLGDAAEFDAVADALKWEAPRSWQRRLLQLTDCQDGLGAKLLAEVYGYRRWPIDGLLARASSLSEKLVWAIGRTGNRDGLALLESLVASDESPLRVPASIALLRWGEASHLKNIDPLVDSEHAAILPLGLLGDTRWLERFARLASVSPSSELLLALGLLGRSAAVELLIPLTGDEIHGEHASTALQLITGADLFESVFIPDEIREEELTEAELERYRNGEPVYEPGCAPGRNVERLSRRPNTWSTWWEDHRQRFDPDLPYRLGRPYAPSTLVAQLVSPRSSMLIRTLAYEELSIRYRLDFAFETDFLVSDQRQILASVDRWLTDHQEVAKRYTGAASF